jgi:hypothetical protein
LTARARLDDGAMTNAIARASLILVVLAGCGGDPKITPSNLSGSIICKDTKSNFNCVNGADLTTYLWDVSGTWTTTSDCSYDAASSNNSDQVGLLCMGSITLSGMGMSPEGITTFAYADVGPNGTGDSFQVYVTSYGSGADESFFATGTDVVQSQGCTSHVDVGFACGSPDGSGLWFCRKASGVRSSDCSNTSGWVVSSGHYTH